MRSLTPLLEENAQSATWIVVHGIPAPKHALLYTCLETKQIPKIHAHLQTVLVHIRVQNRSLPPPKSS